MIQILRAQALWPSPGYDSAECMTGPHIAQFELLSSFKPVFPKYWYHSKYWPVPLGKIANSGIDCARSANPLGSPAATCLVTHTGATIRSPASIFLLIECLISV